MSATEESKSRKRFTISKGHVPEFILGIAAAVLGIFVAYDTTTYGDGSEYDKLGPSLLPLLIAAGLFLSGLSISKSTLGRDSKEGLPETLDWMPVATLALAIAIPIVCLRTFGWVPVISVVFVLGARAFGSKRYLVDLAAGLVFSVFTFAIFNFGLGLSLPVGTLVAKLIGQG